MRDLLAWHEAMGVDAVAADAPVDLTALQPAGPVSPPEAAPMPPEPVPARPTVPAAERQVPPASVPPSAEAATGDARTRAQAAGTLAELENALAGFDGCALRFTATNLVFSDGNPDAPLMVVGEAPGAEEDRQGRPFVGRAGQLLDAMLAAIGFDRTSTYITNILPWRPPGNRQPNPAEIAVCLPFIERHIALKRPKVLILAGGTSAKTLIGTTEGITRLRGRWIDLAVPGLAAPVPAMPLYHPAYLLRSPAFKRDAWRDLIRVADRLEELGVAVDEPHGQASSNPHS